MRTDHRPAPEGLRGCAPAGTWVTTGAQSTLEWSAPPTEASNGGRRSTDLSSDGMGSVFPDDGRSRSGASFCARNSGAGDDDGGHPSCGKDSTLWADGGAMRSACRVVEPVSRAISRTSWKRALTNSGPPPSMPNVRISPQDISPKSDDCSDAAKSEIAPEGEASVPRIATVAAIGAIPITPKKRRRLMTGSLMPPSKHWQHHANQMNSASGPSPACRRSRPFGHAHTREDALPCVRAAGLHPHDHGGRHDRHGEAEGRVRARLWANPVRTQGACSCSLAIPSGSAFLRLLKRRRKPPQPVRTRSARRTRSWNMHEPHRTTDADLHGGLRDDRARLLVAGLKDRRIQSWSALRLSG